MSAYVFVVEHPYYALTDAKGQFELKDVPAGTHTLKFWHENWRASPVKENGKVIEYTYQKPLVYSVSVTVKTGAAAEVNWTVSGKVAFAAAALLVACGSEAAPESDPFPGGTASVCGFVRFTTPPPKLRPIDIGTHRDCIAEHGPIPPEEVVVGPDGGLANVLIRIKDGLALWRFDPPGEDALVDQVGCRYVPHVQGVRSGQTLRVRNSDGFMHNVRALRKGTMLFNLAQNRGSEANRVLEGVGPVALSCEVHGWMQAYVWVVDHPFFMVTGRDGAYLLKGLPAGEYVVEAWHEKYGTRTGRARLVDGKVTKLELAYP